MNQQGDTRRGEYLTWLPKPWPANARLLCSTLPGEAADLMSERQNLRVQELPPLTPTEAEEIIVRLCAGYHRHVHPEVVQAILDKQCGSRAAASNPLWLRVAVERLNRLDADDYALLRQDVDGDDDQRLHRLLLRVIDALPPGVDEVFDWLQARVGKLLGEEWVSWTRAVASLVALGRGGWRENDLRVLVEKLSARRWSAFHFARLRRAWLGYLVQRGQHSQWTFRHDQARQSVLRRNCQTPASRRLLHGEIATYLQALPGDDPLRLETMHHLISARDSRRAAEYYAGDFGSAAEDTAASAALATCAHAPDNDWTTGGVEWVTALLDMTALSETVRGRLAGRYAGALAEALEREAALTATGALLEHTTAVLQSLLSASDAPAEWRRAHALSLRKLGDCRSDHGDLPRAWPRYSQAVNAYRDLAQLVPADSSSTREVAVCLSRLGDIALQQGDLPEARVYYRRYVDVVQELLVGEPETPALKRDLSVGYEKLGHLDQRAGELSAALVQHRACSALLEELLERDPQKTQWQRELAISAALCGEICLLQGRLSEAAEAYRQAQNRTNLLLDADPTDLIWQEDLAGHAEGLAEVWRRQGRLAEAKIGLSNAVELRARLVAKDPSHARWAMALALTHNSLARVALEMGSRETAVKGLRRALNLAQEWVTRDPSNATHQRQLASAHAELADALLLSGDVTEASEHYQEQLRIAEAETVDASDVCRSRDLAAAWQRQAALCHRRGDMAGALDYQERAVALLTDRARDEATDADGEQYLADSRCTLGDLLLESGDLERARANHEASLSALERLTVNSPDNLLFRHALSVQEEHLGDLLTDLGAEDEALAFYQRALASRQMLSDSDGRNRRWRRDLALTQMRVGERLLAQGQTSQGQPYVELSAAALEGLSAEDPSEVVSRRDRVVGGNKLGDINLRRQDWVNAERAYRNSLEAALELAAGDPQNVELQRDVAVCRERVGGAAEAQGNLAAALDAYEGAEALLEALRAGDEGCAAWARDLALLNYRMGFVLANLRRPEAAYERLRRSRGLWHEMILRHQFVPPRQLAMLAELDEFLGPA
ncbi:MAG: hypothetical protein KKI08_19580 [Armatimonadetes bacterium]|nr:hypothetical protein [Armatimonadota bacterium]